MSESEEVGISSGSWVSTHIYTEGTVPGVNGGQPEGAISPARVGCQWSWATNIHTPAALVFLIPPPDEQHTHTRPQKQTRWSTFIPGSNRHKARADGARRACSKQSTTSCKPGSPVLSSLANEPTALLPYLPLLPGPGCGWDGGVCSSCDFWGFQVRELGIQISGLSLLSSVPSGRQIYSLWTGFVL